MVLAKVEVVLPHWEDVRQRKSRQAASSGVRQPVDVSTHDPVRGVHRAHEESRFEQLIKLEQHDPVEVAQALREAVEVSAMMLMALVV